MGDTLLWTGEGETDDFDDKENWENDTAPGPVNEVLIGGGDTVNVNGDVAAARLTVVGGNEAATLAGSSAGLNLNACAVALSIIGSPLNLEGVTLSLAGNAEIDNTLTIENGGGLSFREDATAAELVVNTLGQTSATIFVFGGLMKTQIARIGQEGLGFIALASGGVWLSQGELFVGGKGSGFIRVGGDGHVFTSQSVTLGTQNGILGTVEVVGSGATWNKQNSGGEGLLIVGAEGQGAFTVTKGGIVVIDAATTVAVAAGNNVDGVMTVSGNQSALTSLGSLSLAEGNDSRATFEVLDRASVFFKAALIGQNAQGDAKFTVDGSGSVATLGSLVVGELGPGELKITKGGLLRVNGATSIGANGEVKVDGAGDPANASALESVTLEISSGSLEIGDAGGVTIGEVTFLAFESGSSGTINIADGGVFQSDALVVGEEGAGNLQVAGRVIIDQTAALGSRPGSSGTITVRGAGGFQAPKLQVGGLGEASLTIRGTVLTAAADIGLFGPASPGTRNVQAQGSGKWTNTGRIVVGHNGTLTVDAGARVSTDTMVIESGGVVTGTTVIVSPITSRIEQALSDLGFKFSGTAKSKQGLRLQERELPEEGLIVRELTLEAGSTLVAEQIILEEGGSIGGDGAANLDIISEGTIDPGDEEDETGEFTINGDLTLGDNSEVQVDIGGLIAGEEYDVLTVNGHCQLGGRLKINLVNGYLPNVGDRFEVLKYESREGEYDTIDSDGTGVYFTPELANGRLTLIAAAVDESGRLTPEELADLAQMPIACAPGCGPMGLMPLALTLLGICGIRAGVSRRPRAENSRTRLK